ncbi:MAG: hypothetical protein JEZ12_26670 [Desulfobacterium sp.]|nr:hypothetical protein [Desulfobacterium sp.]
MKNYKTIVVIPARGGSKGIPRKNLRPLNGNPLIYYSIPFITILPKICQLSSSKDAIMTGCSTFRYLKVCMVVRKSQFLPIEITGNLGERPFYHSNNSGPKMDGS